MSCRYPHRAPCPGFPGLHLHQLFTIIVPLRAFRRQLQVCSMPPGTTGRFGPAMAASGSAYSSSWSFQTGSLPTAPQLTSPSNGATNQAAVVALSWGTSNAATSYTVRVTTDGSWGTTIFQQTGLAAAGATVSWNSPNLLPSITYYWEANATNGVGSSPWSAACEFYHGDGCAGGSRSLVPR